MVVSVSLTRFVPRYGKNRVFYPKNAQKWPKLLFLAKNARKNDVLTRNDLFMQNPSVELVEATFCLFLVVFFRIARNFFQKNVIFGCHFLAICGFPGA